MEDSHIVIIVVALSMALVLPIFYAVMAFRDAREEKFEEKRNN